MTAIRLSEQDRADRKLSGAELQGLITELAAMYGYQYLHLRPARTDRGWRTPVEGPLGKGWPDLVLVSATRRRTLAVEVKRELSDPVSPDQAYVHRVLRAAGWEVYVFRPSDLTAGRIQAALETAPNRSGAGGAGEGGAG